MIKHNKEKFKGVVDGEVVLGKGIIAFNKLYSINKTLYSENEHKTNYKQLNLYNQPLPSQIVCTKL